MYGDDKTAERQKKKQKNISDNLFPQSGALIDKKDLKANKARAEVEGGEI